MINRIKSVLYLWIMVPLRIIWLVTGFRRIRAFENMFHVTPDTIFPSYRQLRLPRGGCYSDIVRYCDFVQLHAVCSMVQKIKHAPIIVEVGAHHGAYAIVLGKLVQERGGKIIAVEPDPDSFAVLKANVRLNRLQEIVICEQAAISDRKGQAYFVVNATEGHISGSYSSQGGCLVETLTLAELLEKHAISAVDLLMIDVEGAELPVLRSFPWEDVKLGKIMCELHPYAWADFGYTGDDMMKFLSEHKIRCYDMYFQRYDEFSSESYIGPVYFEFEQ